MKGRGFQPRRNANRPLTTLSFPFTTLSFRAEPERQRRRSRGTCCSPAPPRLLRRERMRTRPSRKSRKGRQIVAPDVSPGVSSQTTNLSPRRGRHRGDAPSAPAGQADPPSQNPLQRRVAHPSDLVFCLPHSYGGSPIFSRSVRKGGRHGLQPRNPGGIVPRFPPLQRTQGWGTLSRGDPWNNQRVGHPPSGGGTRREELYYPFADTITAGILIGFSSDTEEFYALLGKAMSDTSVLMVRFIDAAEFLIARHIREWGFEQQEL